MAVTNEELCDKTRQALNSCVNYIQIKLDKYSEIKHTNVDKPRGDINIRDYITTLDSVSKILVRLKEFEGASRDGERT